MFQNNNDVAKNVDWYMIYDVLLYRMDDGGILKEVDMVVLFSFVKL